MRRTKIIGTIGPASDSIDTLKALINGGLDIARINMSHGDQAIQAKRIATIRKVDKTIPILLDLQGPKIRTGKIRRGHMDISTGDIVVITTKNVLGENGVIPTTYLRLSKDVKKGNRILIDDGLIELKVKKVSGTDVECVVLNGGIIKDHKGINLPGVCMSASGLTPKDIEDLNFAIEQKVDFIAISFVRKPEDVTKVKKILAAKNADIPVIAKIEKPEALCHIDEIIDVSDGIMVARGDLGVELSPEKVPLVQKGIISKCNYFGKPVITATQMLESMVNNPRPTRAEASDIANAVFDGTDVLMLSEEVAVGKYPVESVATMSKIAEEIEFSIYTEEHQIKGVHFDKTIASAVAHAACLTAEELNAKAILAFTSSGSSALRVSKFKTDVPVFAVTTEPKIFNRVKLYFGVVPILTDKCSTTDDMMATAEKAIIKMKKLKKDDIFVIVAGVPIGKSGTTNLIKVHRVGTKLRLEK